MKLSSLLYTSQVYFSKRLRHLEMNWLTSVFDFVNCVPIPVKKQNDPPPMGSWKLNDLLLTQGSKTDEPPRREQEFVSNIAIMLYNFTQELE